MDSNFILSVSSLTDEELELFLTQELNKNLQDIRFKQYFRYNVESYCDFLASILKRTNLSNTISFLKNEIVFSKNLIMEEQFKGLFLEIIFPVLMDNLCKHQDQSLYQEVCGIFKKVILDKKSTEFQSYLETVLKLKEKNNEKYDIPKAVLKIIGTTYNSYLESYSACKVIYQAFVNTFKDFKLIYAFSIAIIEILGFDLTKDFSSKKLAKLSHPKVKLTKSFSLLSDILCILKDSKIDLNLTINISFSQFIENIVKSVIVLSKTPTKECYEILLYSIDIHPLLVERSLDNLLYFTMFDNSKCELSYKNFLMKLFETYAKLHRVQSLLSKMLPILNCTEQKLNAEECYTFRGDEKETQKITKIILKAEEIFPKEVLHYFSQCLMQMASWQYMNVFKTFTFHMDKVVVSFANSDDDTHNSFVELLCMLTSELLKIDKIDENTCTPKTMENFIETMNEVKSILSKLGGALLARQHNQLLVRVFLDLSVNWTDRIYYYREAIDPEGEGIFFCANHPYYWFSFLSNEQWVLLSQRIMNFGESNCKHLMLILTLKKFTIMKNLGNKIEENAQNEVLQQISFNVDNDYKYIVHKADKHLVEKLESDIVKKICDHLLDSENVEPGKLRDIPDIWAKAMCFVLVKKIGKMLFKGKSSSPIKKLLSRANNGLNDLNFEEDDTFFAKIKQIHDDNLNFDFENIEGDDEETIAFYTRCLMKLRITSFCSKFKALIFLELILLHKGLCRKNCEFKNTLEDCIIGMMSILRFDWTQLLDPLSFFMNVTKNFNKKEEFFIILSKVHLKNEDQCKNLVPGIDYLLKNQDIENLQFTLIILKDLKKLKSSKYCSDLRDKILKVNFETVIKSEANVSLIQSYACCLKHCIAQDDKNKLEKLAEKFEEYFSIIVGTKTENIPRGSASLFCIVVPNKHVFKLSQELPSRLWTYCKLKKVDSSELQEFSKLICLIFEHVQNDKFGAIASDLVNMATESIGKQDYSQFSQHLKTITALLTTSLNPVKYGILQKILDDFIVVLYNLKDNISFDGEVFNEIMQFERILISSKPLTLSAGMMSMLLLSPYIFLEKGTDLYKTFNICTNHMECLLKYRSPMVLDRISTYLKVFRHFLSALCRRCGEVEKNKESRLGELDDLTSCAHQLEKLVGHVVKFKRDMESISCYLIADILYELETYTLFPKVKVHLNNCIYSLLSICNQHAISYLLRALSPSSRELFKDLHSKYQKFHTFKGKF